MIRGLPHEGSSRRHELYVGRTTTPGNQAGTGMRRSCRDRLEVYCVGVFVAVYPLSSPVLHRWKESLYKLSLGNSTPRPAEERSGLSHTCSGPTEKCFIWGWYGTKYRVSLHPPFGSCISNAEYHLIWFKHQENPLLATLQPGVHLNTQAMFRLHCWLRVQTCRKQCNLTTVLPTCLDLGL